MMCLFDLVSLTQIYILVFEAFFRPSLLLYRRLPVRKLILCYFYCNPLALKVCAWSHFNRRGTP